MPLCPYSHAFTVWWNIEQLIKGPSRHRGTWTGHGCCSEKDCTTHFTNLWPSILCARGPIQTLLAGSQVLTQPHRHQRVICGKTCSSTFSTIYNQRLCTSSECLQWKNLGPHVDWQQFRVFAVKKLGPTCGLATAPPAEFPCANAVVGKSQTRGCLNHVHLHQWLLSIETWMQVTCEGSKQSCV